MTKVIIIPEENLDSFYERTIQYFQAKYHTYPTTLVKSFSTEDNLTHTPSSREMVNSQKHFLLNNTSG
jgi:hypothetical protein